MSKDVLKSVEIFFEGYYNRFEEGGVYYANNYANIRIKKLWSGVR